MVAIDGLNPVRLTGMAAYGIAALSCAVAWALSRSTGRALGLAAIVGAFEAILFLDVTFSWRWAINHFFSELAMQKNLYSSRRAPQVAALVIVAVVFATVSFLILRRFRRRPGAVLAVWGLLFSCVLSVTEAISLHQIDQILYSPIGSLMPVSFLWIASALITSIGILLEARRYEREGSSAVRI